MVFIELIELEDKYKTGLQHNRPYQLDQELLDTGIVVESLPVKEERPGKRTVLYATKPDKELYYEYVDSPETQIDALRVENLELKLAIAEMAEAHEQSKLETQLALAELAEALPGGVE